MSRNLVDLNENIYIVKGNDHAVGKFVQICDKRAEKKLPEDVLLDYDEFLGFSVNFLSVKKEEIWEVAMNEEKVIELCNNFINSETFQNLPDVDFS